MPPLYKAGRAILFAVALITGMLGFRGIPARAKAITEPPQCTAIVVPGLPRGHADGRHEAWVYKGRFGRLALDGIFRGGVAADYRFTLGGHALDPLQSVSAKAVLPCLRAKGVNLPSRPAPRLCGGERFKVIIARPANERYLALYMASGGNTWRFCRISSIPAETTHPKPKPQNGDAATGHNVNGSRRNPQKPPAP